MRPFALILAKIFDFWHQWISPSLPASCRYQPSCSQYAAQSYRSHGFWRATRLTASRLARCHPWGGFGYDPVPGPKTRGKA
ncbi:MAG TPA: membrane protein insertion efficiency factor YidD [bacterium]|nr:membrane protein insertion efficiency factor YidD [bacterium]